MPGVTASKGITVEDLAKNVDQLSLVVNASIDLSTLTGELRELNLVPKDTQIESSQSTKFAKVTEKAKKIKKTKSTDSDESFEALKAQIKAWKAANPTIKSFKAIQASKVTKTRAVEPVPTRPLRYSRIGSGAYQPRPRAVDCKDWIKKDNFTTFISSTRKRKSEPPVLLYTMSRTLTSTQWQRHAIHLMGRVLSIRSNASPFTLVLDDLNQRALPLVQELVRRALSRNINVVYVSFEAADWNPAVRVIRAHEENNANSLLLNISSAMDDAQESIVIVDNLNDLHNMQYFDMNALFNLVANIYASTLVGIHHQDILHIPNPQNPYAPGPLDLLMHLATSVITCRSFAHTLLAKAAKERSQAEPSHGLLESVEGVVQCLNANGMGGIVLDAEFRRKSGRPEGATFFLRSTRESDYNVALPGYAYGTLKEEFVTLLELAPAYASREVLDVVDNMATSFEATFSLSVTQKQKEARDGVELPYFDAQKGAGGEGGLILYDMGKEDDFDEEEDEI